MNNKKQLSARFDPLKLPFRQDDRKKTKRLGKKLNDSFSSLINDLAPRRYSMADRLTAEITYKLDRLPKNERRGFILNLMCEMLSSQMEAEVQKHIGTLPKPILNVKILNYLQSMLSKEAIKQTENSSDSLLDNSFEQMEENNAMALTNPKAASSSCAEEPESALQQTLQNLVIPSNANSSALFHYTNIIRPMLKKRAKILFPILNEELQPASSLEDNGAFMDIQLSNEVTSDPSYKLLKERTNDAIVPAAYVIQTSHRIRVSQTSQKSFTKQDGESMTNEQIVKSLNESLPFQVYNPQLKKKLPIADSPPVDAQARKRKQPQNIFPVHTPITSQFQNIPPVVAFNLIAPLIQATPIASTSNAQQTNGFIQQPQILLQPSGIIQYRPRNKTCSTTTPNTTDLSVRDFILMRQMPTTNSDAQQQPAKKKRLD
ncbi:hypothetical protein M3Y97_00221400 [Aphelenchoides bicaudatus]|nr:hypothetical protein M3Y97_00221400 [Aphelenchoides bicaudatus]